MKRIINKILLKIMNKFDIPTMDISDKEWEQNLKEAQERFHNALQNEEALVVPTEQTKELAKIIFSDDLEKYRQVNGSLNDEGSKMFCERVKKYLDKKEVE